MTFIKKVKLAFVHDDFIQFGGAEKLLLDIIKEFQKDENFEIKVYSSLVSNQWKGIFVENNIRFEESFLAKIPFCYKIHKLFFLIDLFYFAFLSFDFDSYDVVFSSSTRFGHAILTKPSTFHISYINSPARALWEEKRYFWGKKFFYFILKNFLPQKRVVDFYSQNYSDLIISNSKNIRKKIIKNYKLNSIVLYPFDNSLTSASSPNKKDDYFLIISRLVSWKRIDFVLNAFNTTKLPLIIVGDGSEIGKYKSKSLDNIEFKGYVSETDKVALIKNAKALIFPQNEDFGITLLESLKYYCPVIYYKKGGALEILNDDVGVGFDTQTEESLNLAISKISNFRVNPEKFNQRFDLFKKENFINRIKKIIYQKQKQKNYKVGIMY